MNRKDPTTAAVFRDLTGLTEIEFWERHVNTPTEPLAKTVLGMAEKAGYDEGAARQAIHDTRARADRTLAVIDRTSNRFLASGWLSRDACDVERLVALHDYALTTLKAVIEAAFPDRGTFGAGAGGTLPLKGSEA